MGNQNCSVAGERGAAAVGLLASLLVMGALAVIVLTSLPGSNGTPGLTPGKISVVTGASRSSAGPASTASGAGDDIHYAAVVVCQTDYQAVEAAVSYYQAVKGSLPTSMGSLKSLLHSSVASLYFTIIIDPHRAGVVEVGTTSHSRLPGEGNCAFAG